VSAQPTIDAIGYAAAVLVLATFSMRSMSALRWVAIAGNLAFIAYGYVGSLTPVLFLHALLLPVNLYRLAQLCRASRAKVHPQRSVVTVRETGSRGFDCYRVRRIHRNVICCHAGSKRRPSDDYRSARSQPPTVSRPRPAHPRSE